MLRRVTPKVQDDILIQRCLERDRRAQQMLYERYSTKMWGVVRRYMKDSPAGEDVMVEAFYKVFSKLNTFKHNGSFEGWIRRIVVNECLMKQTKNPQS